MANVEVLPVEPAVLGESPLWSDAEQVLYWADIDGRAVHRYDPSTGVDEVRPLASRPGSLALGSEVGSLLVATEHEVVWLDWASGDVTPWIDLEPAGVGIRLNDGKTDPAGRFIVGSMFEDVNAARRDGSLWSVEPDGTTRRLLSGIGVSNGLGFDAARGLMYFADTPTKSVRCWDYDLASGDMANERELFNFDALRGLPDGACVDSDGCYWSAAVYGSQLIRVTPDGSVDMRVELPVHKPSMPAFGGPSMDTIFVTSISSGGASPAEPGESGVAAGSLIAVDVSAHGITGRPDAIFAGAPGGR